MITLSESSRYAWWHLRGRSGICSSVTWPDRASCRGTVDRCVLWYVVRKVEHTDGLQVCMRSANNSSNLKSCVLHRMLASSQLMVVPLAAPSRDFVLMPVLVVVQASEVSRDVFTRALTPATNVCFGFRHEYSVVGRFWLVATFLLPHPGSLRAPAFAGAGAYQQQRESCRARQRQSGGGVDGFCD